MSGLTPARAAIAPSAAQGSSTFSMPTAAAYCGHAWVISNCQYGHVCVPEGRKLAVTSTPASRARLTNVWVVMRDSSSRP